MQWGRLLKAVQAGVCRLTAKEQSFPYTEDLIRNAFIYVLHNSLLLNTGWRTLQNYDTLIWLLRVTLLLARGHVSYCVK